MQAGESFTHRAAHAQYEFTHLCGVPGRSCRMNFDRLWRRESAEDEIEACGFDFHTLAVWRDEVIATAVRSAGPDQVRSIGRIFRVTPQCDICGELPALPSSAME